MESSGLHTINFMGLDSFSSTGQPISGVGADPWHYNDTGHAELYSSISPSMFNYVTLGYAGLPQTEPGCVLVDALGGTETPMLFTPLDPIGSFTVFFRRRFTPTTSGPTMTYCAISTVGDRRVRALSGNGRLVYTSSFLSGDIDSGISINDNKSHSVAVSYSVVSSEVRFYVDGVFVGSGNEGIALDKIALGNRLPNTFNGGVTSSEYKDFLVYRTRLHGDVITDLHRGKYWKSSLELFAPLSDKDTSAKNRLINIAPTNAYLEVVGVGMVYPSTGGIVSEANDLAVRRIDMIGGGSFFIDADHSLKYRSPSGTITAVAPA
jgi:hypothetical protein